MQSTPRRAPYGGLSATVAAWLPRGGALSEGQWAARHRGICVLLWAHVLALPAIAVLRGETALHGLVEGAVVAAFAVVAALPRLSRRQRSSAATLGLLMSSAFLVHLFGGVIEAHFHFFVVVAVVALYQAWTPYLLALGFVVLHHSVVGTLAPYEVYDHGAALINPWVWGAVHAGFILAQSIACLVSWQASEEAVLREREVRLEAEKEHRDLADAQRISGMGSWEWDVTSDTVTWSDQLCHLVGVDRATFVPSVSSFLDLVVPEDQIRISPLIEASVRDGTRLDYECRLLRPDGEERTIHALGDVTTDGEGTVTQMRGTVHDVTERRRLQDAVIRMAFEDPLTGLANRRSFLERLEAALAPRHGGRVTCAVLFVDLDGFKAVNDRYGHAAGDALLRDVATRLRTSVRDTDTVARFGGDEFAILCEGGDHEVALTTARRIETQLRGTSLVNGAEVVVAASVGIAVARSGDTADGLLHRADQAMYDVKARTRPGRPAVRARDVGSPTQV